MNDNIEHPVPVLRPDELRRRGFFARLCVLLGGGIVLGLSAPMVAFILAPLGRRTPQVWRAVGRLEEFEIGRTVDVRFDDPSALPWAGVTARSAAWLRRESETELIAFSVHCTHLGCPVRWMPQARLFLCPCHGGVFYENGGVAAGPPDRPLRRHPVRINEGVVEIQTAPLPATVL